MSAGAAKTSEEKRPSTQEQVVNLLNEAQHSKDGQAKVIRIKQNGKQPSATLSSVFELENCDVICGWSQSYLYVSPIISTALFVIIPLVIMIALNSILVIHLKKHKNSMHAFADGSETSLASSQTAAMRQQARVTAVVTVIVGSFIVLNIPTAILHLTYLFQPYLHRKKWHKIAVEVSNALIVTSKTINFILYCMSSQHFRRKTKNVLRHRMLGPVSSGLITRPATPATRTANRKLTDSAGEHSVSTPLIRHPESPAFHNLQRRVFIHLRTESMDQEETTQV